MITHLLSARRLSKGILLATSVAALAACTGNPTPSSSSAPQQQSSSSVAISSAPMSSSSIAPSSSSIASSSSVAPSSSSMPPSSSSVASSSSAPSNGGAATLLTSDGTFANGAESFGGNAFGGYDPSIYSWNGELVVNIQSNATAADQPWEAQLTHGLSLTGGQQYSYCFKAKATVNRDMPVNIDTGPDNYASLMGGGEQASLTSNYQNFKYTFTASETDASARITMTFGTFNQADWGTIYVDDIGVYEGSECGDPSNTPAAVAGSGGKHIIDYIAQNNAVPPITTAGNKVLFDGKPGSIAGVSLFWSNTGEGEKFYTADVVSQLKNGWGASLVRAAMAVEDNFSAGGYLTNRDYNVSRVTTVVDAAIANNMYAIIDWHSHEAEKHEAAAIEFFETMAAKYRDHDNVIYEVYNEPIEAQWSTDIKPYALKVIEAIRKIDPDNLIIVGTRSWSQRVDEAASDPITGYDNIAYTLHFYAADPFHQQQLREFATTAMREGIPLFVTEWGTVNANGDGNFDEEKTDVWLQFLYDNDISHANWSLTDKNEGASILTSGNGSGWSDNNLTESGRYIKQMISEWNQSIRPGE